MMDLLGDVAVWLLFSFVIFTVIVWRAGKQAVLNMLDARIEDIRKEIETAENLRVEAQELLAQYQRKHRDAIKEAEGIIATAQAHADEILKKAEIDLQELITRREKNLKERLTRMEQSATAEIQKYAANLAIQATAEIIARQLDKTANERLVDEAIEDVGVNLN